MKALRVKITEGLACAWMGTSWERRDSYKSPMSLFVTVRTLLGHGSRQYGWVMRAAAYESVESLCGDDRLGGYLLHCGQDHHTPTQMKRTAALHHEPQAGWPIGW